MLADSGYNRVEMSAAQARSALRDCRRLVVKIGSRALLANADAHRVLAEQVSEQKKADRSVVVVSSGAIAFGRERLGFSERPKTIARLQAAAAAGQSLMMRAYEDAFEARGVHVAQVLLTHGDLADRERYLNARRSIEALLELDVVPIINENDAVAIEELRFGDNDQLAAMAANLVRAELLVMLTSVDGILDDKGQRVSVVSDVSEVIGYLQEPTDDLGLGGMGSKVEAARQATLHGVPVVIAPAAKTDVLSCILRGDDIGTLILPHGSPLASRKHWIAYTLKPKGSLVIDDGAVRAVVERNKSLLPAGIVRTDGRFSSGDSVRIVDEQGQEVARGLARYGAAEVKRLAGKQTREIGDNVDNYFGDEIVHRDDLVVTRD